MIHRFFGPAWFAGFFICLLLPAHVHAAMTEWQDLGGGKARLVATMNADQTGFSAVLQVELKPGWSTYWRYPGAAGIPPNFDFSRSKGIVVGEPSFPVPKLLGEEKLRYAGYKEKVGFPFEGQLDPSTDAMIRLDLLIGVCETICIPATARFEIPGYALLKNDPGAQLAFARAKSLLPRQMGAEEIIKHKRLDDNGNLKIVLHRKDLFHAPDLFVEGPSDWYLTPAKLAKSEDKYLHFTLKISDAREHADVLEEPLIYTLSEKGNGIEFRD